MLLCLIAFSSAQANDSPSGASAKPGLHTSASAPDSLVAKTALLAALERIERSGSSRAPENDLALLALLAQVAPGSAEHVEVLALRGSLNADQADKKPLLERLIKELEAWPNPAQRGAARLAAAHLRAKLLLRQGQPALAIKSLEMVDSVADNEASLTLRLRSLGLLASLLSDAGEVDAGINTSVMALRLAEQSGAVWRRANALVSLSFSYMRAQQLERAKQLIAEAQQLALLDPDPMSLSRVYNVRGMVYSELGDAGTAGQAMQLALDYARQTGNPVTLALALGNAADSQLRKSDFLRARQLSEEALVLALATHDLNSETLARQNIGMAKIGLRQIAEGKREVIAAIGVDEAQGQFAQASDGWLELAKQLERFGDQLGAVQAYHHYRKLNDQVLREDSRRAVLEAQARFDNERQAKEIEALNQGNQLKAEQVRAGDLRLRLWAALGGCVLLSGLLMWLAYQRIGKTNQALALSNESLKRQGERDPLTGLANRRHFQAAIKRLADKGRFSGTVFLIDIDHFKRVNDSRGHAAGDAVLVEVARRLRLILRDEDMVVRWGGEEFLIVVDGRDADAARVLAQRLLDNIAQPPVPCAGGDIAVTASLGFASFPLAPHDVALSWERAIDLVDTVMYMAKAHGRNRAYGIKAMQASDAAGVAELSARIEAAWHEGTVELLALLGASALVREEEEA
ncbi:GGDEF domain-containing protein [Roseateles albus]|uniref:diguanylate cyclase n=1 Tax=Roseateles albus TaxID=2987525 RepID=A0ABT5KAY6_9BURK|nr:GGDEF domain-containing protein [Roseateles albus]MDC8771096.1 GGDEF domain-containing protein [Roseateles albus]